MPENLNKFNLKLDHLELNGHNTPNKTELYVPECVPRLVHVTPLPFQLACASSSVSERPLNLCRYHHCLLISFSH